MTDQSSTVSVVAALVRYTGKVTLVGSGSSTLVCAALTPTTGGGGVLTVTLAAVVVSPGTWALAALVRKLGLPVAR